MNFYSSEHFPSRIFTTVAVAIVSNRCYTFNDDDMWCSVVPFTVCGFKFIDDDSHNLIRSLALIHRLKYSIAFLESSFARTNNIRGGLIPKRKTHIINYFDVRLTLMG